MNEIVQFLNENALQYFATVGLDGKPKVRPFQFMFEKEGKLWFCTGNDKEVYKEMSNNPYIESCSCTPDYKWLRLSGKAVFSEDTAIKEEIVEKAPLVKMVYKSADNPVFEIFYLEEAKGTFYVFGEPPKEIKL